MMADIGTVPVRTRSVDEIAAEIVKMIDSGDFTSDLLGKIAHKVLADLRAAESVPGLHALVSHHLANHLRWCCK
jgi:hypothetical protein